MKTAAEIRLAQGDCLRLMEAIPDGSVNLVLCDPPYGVTACKWDRRIPFEPLRKHYLRTLADRGTVLLFAQQPFATALAASAPPGWLRYEWIWDKGQPTGFANARRMPMRRHENVLVFYRRLPNYHPMGLRPCRPRTRMSRESEVYGTDAGAGRRIQRFTGYPQSIVTFRRDAKSLPCQKPTALLEFLIRTYTDPGDTVLDNAMGSGSTGVAAVNTERSFVGIEVDPCRFQIAVGRISAAMMGHHRCGPRTFWGAE